MPAVGDGAGDWLAEVAVVLLLHCSHLLCSAVAVVSPLAELTAEAGLSVTAVDQYCLLSRHLCLLTHSHSVHICLHCILATHSCCWVLAAVAVQSNHLNSWNILCIVSNIQHLVPVD